MDYSYFINHIASRRRPAIIRVLTKLHYTEAPNAISLAEGMPNEATFPFEQIQITLKGGEQVELSGKELGVALQYLPTQGYPPLLKTLKEFTIKIHNPPNWDNSDIIITNGSQCGLSKSIEMCVEDGDFVLVQNPMYGGVEIALSPHRAKLIAMEQDEFGIIPELLRQNLEELQIKCNIDDKLKMPKMMYVNPTGANPNGTTMPLDRKQEVYRIACQYNILILEDDPYYFLHFAEETTPSFLSLDTEGRVLRFDSFSKILSSGLRIGWLIGPKPLVAAIGLHIESAYLHPSTLSQVLISKLLTTWGDEKLLNHFEYIRAFYKSRRDCIQVAMEKHLTDLAEWAVPSAGIFMWLKIKDIRDGNELLIRGMKKNIMFTPGNAFMVNPSDPCNYIRISFSKISLDSIDLAFRLLAEVINEEKKFLNKDPPGCI